MTINATNIAYAAFAFSAFAGALTTPAFAANPFITTLYTADPSAHVWSDGRLYVYPSRDIDPPAGCDRMDKYHVFSTDDMSHWRDEGQILEAGQIKWGRPEGGFMWAPDCAYKDGKYYFYFPHPSDHDWNNSWKVGVAVSTNPASGFVPLDTPITGVGGFAMIDPSVFVDTDGQAYLYYGGGGHCQAGRLKANMIELADPTTKMEGLTDFHEATRVFRRNDTYYLTYADNHPGQNRLCYATGSNPLGPWKSQGVYLDKTGCDTSHGSVVEYKGQWYAFYHNQAISNTGVLRSICVDKLEFSDDGKIELVKQTTEGVPPLAAAVTAPLETTTYPASTATIGGGATLIENVVAPEGKSILIPNSTASFCQFEKVDGGPGGRAEINISYATSDKAKIKLFVNGDDCSFLNMPATSNLSAFDGNATFTLPLKAGKVNTVKITGAKGRVNIQKISVTLLPEN